MIHIVYHRTYHKVTLEGHALSGEHGHDLVCASVSTLAYTLANSVENMGACGLLREKQSILKEGEAMVICKPAAKYVNIITLVFDTLCSGFEMLAHNFPENISYEVRG